MNARMKQQGGWAGSFVIVGILLALLLVGGVYFLKSNQAQDGNVAVDAPAEEKSTDEKSQKNDSDDKSSNDRKQSSEGSELPSGGQEVGDSEEQQNLPQTGPSDTIAASMILGLVAYSGAAYIRSRGHSTL